MKAILNAQLEVAASVALQEEFASAKSPVLPVRKLVVIPDMGVAVLLVNSKD